MSTLGNIRPAATARPHRQLSLFIACLILCFFYQFLCMSRQVSLYDEGVILFGAVRAGEGDVPHRDFYANYGPAQFYILAGLFKAFSQSVLVERVWDAIAKSLSAALILLIVLRTTGSVRAAVGTALVCVAWLASFGNYGYPVFPTLAAAFAALLCLLPGFECPSSECGRRGWPVAGAGACAGIATLFRYDIGIATCLVLLSIVGLHAGLPSGATRRNPRAAAVAMAAFACGFLCVTAPVLAAFAAGGVLPDLWFDVVIFPSRYYRATRSLPFPDIRSLLQSPANLISYLPVVLAALAIPSLVFSGRQLSVRRWSMITLMAMTLIFLAKGSVRVSPIHMAMAIIAALALTGVSASGGTRRGIVARTCLVLAIPVAAFCTSLALNDNIQHAAANVRALAMGSASCRVPDGLERLRCFSVDTDHEAAIRFLLSRTRPGDVLFAGLGRHDKILMNDVAIYFLSGLRSATRWHHFDPGLQTSEPVQRAMAGELEASQPRFVVLESQWDDAREPNESAASSGVHVLDDYIASHFRLAATFGTVRIMEYAGAARAENGR